MVLYNAFRPTTFEDVIGQEPVVVSIAGGLRSERFSHAYLLSGPRGTGKTTVARLIAMYLNCEGLGLKPCGNCAVCSAIQDGRYTDVIEVNAASTRGIDAIRDLKDSTLFAPVSGKYKVFIVDEVHMLTTEASNAVLKVLEEPPATVVFILATTEEHKILPTIKSRCQIHRFRLVPKALILKRLEYACESQNLIISKDTLTLLAEEANGSLRDALSLLDLVINLENREVGEVRKILGRVEYALVGDFIDCLVERSAAKALKFVNDLYVERYHLEGFAQEVTAWLMNLLRIRAGADFFTHPMLERMREQALSFQMSDLIICIEKFLERETVTIIPQLGIELAICEVCDLMSVEEDF